MGPVERDAPPDAKVRHQQALSLDGRALIPMWDSSDPERAPPPLPLNPQSPSVSPSRAGTSLAIQSAHAALTEKARETALVPSLARRMTDSPPEWALTTRSPSPHKRTQTLSTGNSVRDLSLMIEGARGGSETPTPRGSPEKTTRPSTPARSQEPEKEKDDADREPPALSSPTPTSANVTPTVRPSLRRPPQSILGENTPPQSATMLALQNMATPRDIESPLGNVTNNSSAMVKVPQSFDHISGQIFSLTSIATQLQKEMTALSRRSRDNATDLMSLKEATHARDEDIRKSLRELVTNIDNPRSKRDTQPSSGSFMDSARGCPSPSAKPNRPISLPRIPSPNSFAASFDRESGISTPSLVNSVNSESPATIALLEKIIREMGTKDGQDSVLGRLTDLAERLTGMASSGKVEELIQQLKTANHERFMIPASGGAGGGNGGGNRPRKFSFEEGDDDDEHDRGLTDFDWSQRNGHGQQLERFVGDLGSRRSSAPTTRGAEVLSNDVINIIQSVKDSVSQGGGMTAEVKALVRELRGEVLGMGRDIARKLDEVESNATAMNDPASKDELARVVEEGLDQMKQQMDQVLREHRRSSSASTKSAVDYQEIYNAMRTALNDTDIGNKGEPDLSREDVMLAVKEAWENYKPDITVEQIGLERDEVLACLQEGLQEYAPKQDEPAITKEEVYRAVVEGLKHFVPPQVESPAALSRDEILEAVRECLEEFEFPIAPSAIGNDVSREDMVDAVQEGLKSFDFPQAQHNESGASHGADNSEVIDRLHDIMQFMQDEFRSVSEEAKQNVAANGRDTEQVLDATKDGFDQLRNHMEGYVDRVSGGAGQEELMNNMLASFDNFRDEISELVAKASDGSKSMLKEEVESLRDTVNSSLVPHVPQAPDNREALDAIREGVERVRQELLRPHAGTTDILDALHEGFSDLKTVVERIGDKPSDLTANDEILDAIDTGLKGVRTDIGSLRETNNEQAVANIGASSQDAVVPTDMLKHEDIKNLEVMMTQLRIKVEAMEGSQPASDVSGGGGLSKEDLGEVEDMIRGVQDSVSAISNAEVEESIRNVQASIEAMSNVELEEAIKNLQESVSALTAAKDPETVNPEDASTKEDVQAIETILRNTKARLEEIIDDEQAVKKDHLDAVEKLVLETKESVGSVSGQLEELSRKEDLVSIESLATQINASLDEMKERAEKALEDPEKVTKTDVDAIEAAVMDIKNVVDQINNKPDTADLPSKDDLKALEDILKEVKESGVTHAEANAKHFEERQAETVGVGERVTEVKTFLEEFQGTVKDKLESGAEGVENVRQLLETLKDGMGDNSGVSAELKEILDTLKTEFEESKAGVVGSKLDTDEKLQSATDTLGGKIDDKIGELISKYDEFQTVMEERTKAGEARDVEMEAAVVSTKAITDELKVLIDTLGSSVTDSLEKMEEASQTVFSQVEQMYTKSDENHTDIKDEHQTTRDQIKEAVALVEGLQGQVSETQPQILDAVKEVLLIVGQHYEHSKSSVSDLHQKLEDAKPESDESRMLPAPADKFDDSEIHSKLDSIVGSKYDDSTVQSKLDKIVEEKYDDSEVLSRLDKLIEEKYSDEEVHSKLDKLMEGKTDEDIHSKLDKLLEGASTDEEVHAKLDKLVEEKYDDTEVLARLEKLMEDKYDDGEVKEKLDKLIEEKYDDIEVIARLEKLLEDKYDDTEVLARLEKITEDKYDDADLQAKVDKLSEDKYDDAELKAKIDELLEAKFDDTELKAKIDQLLEEKYDDAELKAKIDQVLEDKYDDTEVRARLDKLVEERYDDTEVRAQLTTISEQKYDDAEVITRLDKIIEEKYDDAEIRSRLDKLSEEKYDDTEVRAQLTKLGEEKYDDTEVRNQLAKIIEERYDDSELQVRIGDLAEQLDPSNMHSKLDQLISQHETGEVQQKLSKLVDHTEAADKAYAQLETLDKVHSQVVQTAAEISEFLTAQRQRITDEHEDREKTLQETNVSLERQRAEQQQVEANVAQLRDEEAELRQSVAALRAEQESLNRQKIRMTADVSSLETALHIRREELHEMDMRAEGLERRILEGVLDHSRSLLMNKPKPKGREAMSRKRVPGARTSLTPAEVAEPVSKPSPRPKAVNMAMASNRTSMVPGSQSPANRRILSLSQITNNTPTGGLARSKSVRTPAAGGLRKSSWAPGRIGAGKAYGDLDKENDLVKEADEPLPPLSSRGPSPEPDDIDLGSEPEPEPELPILDDDTATEMGPEDQSEDEGAMTAPSGDEGDDRDALSETGTLRRSSQGTTVVTGGAGTDAEDGEGDEDSYYSGDDYDSRSEYTDSAVGTESVVTGAESYVTESVGDDAESIAGDGEVVLHTG